MDSTTTLDSKALASCLKELSFKETQIKGSLKLLITDKASLPFVARYRKEATGGLDDLSLIKILDSYNSAVQLEKRREFIIDSIKKLEKLTPELQKKILNTNKLNQLEDIYAPFKSKQKTKAQKAIDQGLEPLSILLLTSSKDIKTIENDESSKFISKEKGIETFTQALEGAMSIITEKISHNEKIKDRIRKAYWSEGLIKAGTRKDYEKIETHQKYKDYFEFEQKISELKNKKNSYRYLALRRGMLEKVLSLDITLDKDTATSIIKNEMFNDLDKLGSSEIIEKCITRSFSVYISTSLSLEIKNELKDLSDLSAIEVFGENLKNLLLQPYLGQKAVLGIDPGVRTGCKVVVIDKNGNYLIDTVVYPHPPKNDSLGTKKSLDLLIEKFDIKYVAIGNGTFGRETLSFVQKNIERVSSGKVKALLVNEDGASIYSASEVARDEFPDKDVTVRGAVSIARRFQDPLGELVKIDPKSIGVGQYQHDVNAIKLKKSLTQVVEGCVNHVGVDLNTASAPLLSYISGVGQGMAKNIVAFRKKNSGFSERSELLKVSRFTEKTFEESAGFLRIYDAKNPLDSTFIHPENYSILENWCLEKKISLEDLVKEDSKIRELSKDKSLKEQIGEFTFEDIVKCLKSPSQDPRTEFKPFDFRKDIETIADLKVGGHYPGQVTNITQFGAFVDIGLKENGLIHISQMSDTFVEDPLKVLKVGQEVNARVLEVDQQRKRIALSLKSEDKQTKVKGSFNSSSTSKKPFSSNNRNQHGKGFKSNNTDDKDNPFSALKKLKL